MRVHPFGVCVSVCECVGPRTSNDPLTARQYRANNLENASTKYNSLVDLVCAASASNSFVSLIIPI